MSRDDEDDELDADDSFESSFNSRPVSVRKKTRFSGKLFAYFFFGFFLFVGTIIAMGFAKQPNGQPAPMAVGLIIMAIGAGGLWFTSRPSSPRDRPDQFFDDEQDLVTDSQISKPRIRVSSDLDEEEYEITPGPVTLAPGETPTGTFIGCLIGSAFVFVFCGFFFSSRFEDWGDGKFEVLPDVFAIPAGIVCLLCVLGTIHAFLAMFNPKPVLTLSRQAIPLGAQVLLEWRFEGNPNSIRTMAFILEGIESARYQRGTSTYTDTNSFFKETLLETTDRVEIAEGKQTISVPGDTMHTFEAANNKIIWQLRLKGDIPFWPDVTATFPIRVIPHEPAT